MGVAHLAFGIIYKYRIVTLGLGINDNQISAEDPSDEETLLVVISVPESSPEN